MDPPINRPEALYPAVCAAWDTPGSPSSAGRALPRAAHSGLYRGRLHPLRLGAHWLCPGTAGGIIGSVAHPAEVAAVRVLVGARSFGQVRYCVPRTDVAAALPNVPGFINSGVTVSFSSYTFPVGCPQLLSLEFTAKNGSV